VLILSLLATAAPDIGRLFQNDPGDWTKFYQWAHDTWYCYLIPFWNLHIAEDYLVHQPGGGWYWWTKYLELGLWGIEVIFLYFILKRIKGSKVLHTIAKKPFGNY